MNLHPFSDGSAEAADIRAREEEHYFEHRAPVADEREDPELKPAVAADYMQTICSHCHAPTPIAELITHATDGMRTVCTKPDCVRWRIGVERAEARKEASDLQEMIDREWPRLDAMKDVAALYVKAQEMFERYQAADKAGASPHEMLALSIQHAELRVAADRHLKTFRGIL